MTRCRLLFTRWVQISQAARFFWFFKPSECVQGEPFDLCLTFKNDSNHGFQGGECDFRIKGELAGWDFAAKLPPIKPHESETVIVRNITIPFVGSITLSDLILVTENRERVPCSDIKGRETLVNTYPLALTSKEEIYQKYAVIVALFFSTIAAILTIINVLVSIFR